MTSPRDALKEAGAEVLIVSPKNGKVKAKSGDDWTKDYDVDLQLNNTKPTEFDALVIPGGVINAETARNKKMTSDSIAGYVVKTILLLKAMLNRTNHGYQIEYRYTFFHKLTYHA